MPLFFTRRTDEYIVGVWKLSETLEELQDYITLSSREQEKFSAFKFEHRKKEWLTTRVLLKNLFPDSPEIAYSIDGKPYLPGVDKAFSLSHSRQYVAVILANSASCGIDIEDTSRNIEKVALKFLAKKENEQLGSNDRIKKLFMHWCGKETIFKLIEDSGVNFSTQIILDPIDTLESEGEVMATFYSANSNTRICLNYLFFESHLLTWALN